MEGLVYLLGVVVALVVQVAKKLEAWNSFMTYTLLLLLSVCVGAIWQFASIQDWWPVALKVLSTAAAFHNLVMRAWQKT